MGKAKGKGFGVGAGKTGGGGRGGDRTVPYGQDQNRDKERGSGLVADLTSLDEQRRVNACHLISGVFESSSGASSAALVTRQLLSALVMRLVDQCKCVDRLSAA